MRFCTGSVSGAAQSAWREPDDSGKWDVISNPQGNERLWWSLRPPVHYAFPAVAKRHVLEESSAPCVAATLLGAAPKEACEQFFIDFQSPDKNLSERMKSGDSEKDTATD